MTQLVADTVKKRLSEVCKNSRQHVDMQRLMTRYAIERFMWRVGQSRHAAQFTLKGAMALTYYVPDSTRTTKDVDFSMSAQYPPEKIKTMLSEIARIKMDDGVKFNSNAITLRSVGQGKAVEGYSARIPARLSTSICNVDMNISHGDAIYPDPPKVSIPSLLAAKAQYPILRIYPIETIIAEKYQTIVRLGMSNTRLKDHHDLYELLQSNSIAGKSLVRAIQGTFEQRGAVLDTTTIPIGLSEIFYVDKIKQKDWKAALSQYNMQKATPLDEACLSIASMILPVLSAIASEDEFDMVWDKKRWKSL